MTFPLTALCLRFHCQAETSLQLGGLRAGSNLRGALVNVMRRTTCDLTPINARGGIEAYDPNHAAHCPVCWLVAANDHPGQERRGYAIVPPIDTPDRLEPGMGFIFHITLFGEADRYLPYFILAVPDAGRIGIGPGRGRFNLISIYAEHPNLEDWQVLKPGESLVHPPEHSITHADILQAANVFTSRIESPQPLMRVEFLTPLRLILGSHLLKSPDFGAIFNHILRRVDELSIQHAGGEERSIEERMKLWNLANGVRLIESQVHWEDIPSGSTRNGRRTWISGLVGPAWYRASTRTWRELMPWLLWGQIVQVGKDTSKGNGIFRISM